MKFESSFAGAGPALGSLILIISETLGVSPPMKSKFIFGRLRRATSRRPTILMELMGSL